MPIILLIYYSYAVDFQRQGRYALPNIILCMYYVVRGYEKLIAVLQIPQRLQNVIIGMCILLLVSSSLYMTYMCSLPLYLESGLALESLVIYPF